MHSGNCSLPLGRVHHHHHAEVPNGGCLWGGGWWELLLPWGVAAPSACCYLSSICTLGGASHSSRGTCRSDGVLVIYTSILCPRLSLSWWLGWRRNLLLLDRMKPPASLVHSGLTAACPRSAFSGSQQWCGPPGSWSSYRPAQRIRAPSLPCLTAKSIWEGRHSIIPKPHVRRVAPTMAIVPEQVRGEPCVVPAEIWELFLTMAEQAQSD